MVEKRAQFVRPKSAEHIANEIAEIHAVMDADAART